MKERFFRKTIGKMTAAAFLCVMLGGTPLGQRDAAAQEWPSLEYRIKAAVLLNLLKFVEWPPQAFEDAAQPIVIGILGLDPFSVALDQIIRGRTIQRRKIIVHRSYQVEELKTYHVLFISRPAANSLALILNRLGTDSILTVSDAKSFAENGGMIGLIKRNNKVHFQINVAAAEKANLKISSKLLRLAQIVAPVYGRGNESA